MIVIELKTDLTFQRKPSPIWMKKHWANFLLVALHFCVSFESKIWLYKIHASINQPRPCQNTACNFIYNDWYVLHRRCLTKGTLISKSHILSTIWYIPQRRHPFIFLFVWKCFWLPWLKTNTLQMFCFNQTPLFCYVIAWWQSLPAAKL